MAQGRSVFIEVSTHPLLVNALSTTIEESSAAGAGVGTLSRGAGDRATFLLALAQAFVSGVPADLRTRDGDGDPLGFRDRGLPARLPAYPFARTRLWLPATPAGAVDAAALGGSDVAGPLVTARLHTPGAGGEVFTGRIAVDDPAAAVGLLVELALEAGDEAGYALLARLDVTGPLPPARECIAQVHLAEVGGERTAFTIHVRSTGGEDDWVQVAEGELRDSPAVATVPDPLPASATVDPELVTGTVHTGGAGPDESPVSIAAVRRGPEALDVDLDLPDDSDHPDSAAAILAPALLGAAGTLAGHLLDPDGAAAPLAVLRVEGLGSLLQGVRAVRIALRMRGGTESGAVVDMTITDRTGAPVTPTATLTLGTPRTMAASAIEARRTMYVVDWRDAAPHDVAVGTGQERGPEPYLVPDGTDATAPQRAREVTETVLERLREHLAADDPEAVLAIHTRHAVVTGLEHEEANPVHAAVWGLVRSAQTETPGRFVLIDSDGHPDSAAAVSAAGRAGHPQVAVRAGRLCLPRLRRYSEHPSDSPRPANNGTVLVTGATGGLGRMVAEHLVREHGVRDLVLVSRGGPRSSGADELIANLIDLGARPELVACDAADRDAIAEVIAGITAHRPPLRAVIHTAGVLDDATIANLTREKIDAVFRAKVDALEHLDELTADLDLDYFLVYSSMVASFGNPGQANYAAANAYMESLISRRRRRGLAGTAIGWGYRATDSAMSAHLSELDISRIRRTGVIPLGADQGMAVVDTLLAAPGQDAPPAVLAVPFDPTVITSRATDPELSPLIRSLAPPSRRRAVATRTTTGTALQRLLARALPAEWRRLTAELVRTQVRTVLGTAPDSPLDGGRALRDIGFDSLTSVELRNRLAAETGLALPTTLVFDHPTPDHLTDYLLRQVAEDEEAPDGVDDAAPDRPDASPRSLDDDPIVIVSMACRLPGGVRSADDLWNLVAHGRHGIGPFPEDRGWPAELYHADPAAKGHSYTRHGGFIYDAAEFDAGFFGMSPREALATDPQHRLMLETVWEALEEAAIDPHSLRGANVGVYIGSVGQDYVHLGDRVDESLEGFLVTGRASSVLSGRVSYTFGFEGPAITVDTACSSSLVALHLAVTALRRDECEMAVVGGVSIMADPGLFIEFSRQRGLAADGHCKTFSEQADGTAWAEGIGVLLVERRSHALRYGHRILAEVSGTAINQDGASNGLTAPSGPAQRRVIAAALADAGVAPSEIDLVEAHGTGTPLGDPIEAGALIEAYGEHRDGAAPLYVGALKTNTGHTQGAAGIAGVIKTVLALRHQLMPRSLWGRNRSSAVTWQGVELLPDERPWPHGERRRRAGVSAFGISGTNAHVIVSEPVVPSDTPHRAPEGVAPEELGLTVWPVSADDPDALSVLLESVPHALEHTADPADAGAALTTGRAQLTHRAVLLPGEPEPIARGAVTDAGTVFVFSGQGGQWLDMGRALAEASPTFASALDDVCAAVDRYLDRPIRDIMWHSDSGDSGTDALLNDTRYSQPAIFAIQVALLRLVEALGLRPDAVIGHSVGEVAAAHAAGILGLDAAARFIAARGTQMSAAPAGGAMAAIAAPPDRVHGLITRDASPHHGTDPVVIAAINGPAAVTVSGSAAAVAAAVDAATAAGIRTKTLQVSHAFHSAQMAAAAHGLAGVADEIDFQKPRIPFLPTGGRSRAVHNPAYWTEQVTAPVDFLGAVNEAAERGPARYLVLGPDSALVAALREATNGSVATALMSPKTGTTAQGAARDAATALGRLWADGAPVTWAALYRDRDPHAVRMPSYPFQRKHYWIIPDRRSASAPPTGLCYESSWIPIPAAAGGAPVDRVVLAVAADTHTDVVDTVRKALLEAGHEPIVATVDEIERSTIVSGATTVLALLSFTDSERAPEDTLRLAQLAERSGAALVVVTGADGGAHTAVAALARTIGLEAPHTISTIVQIASPTDLAQAGRLAGIIGGSPEREIAVSTESGIAGRRLVRVDSADTAPFRPSGTVLITGGTGGLGSEIARWCARNGAERVVLASRGGERSPGAASLVAELDELGTDCTVLTADCGDRPAFRSALSAFEGASGGEITAVFHAAGIVDFTSFTATEPADVRRLAAGKVTGARVLDEYFHDRELDAFVLFSSIAATWGSAGQSAYSAANGYLDGLAAQRRARGLAAISVAWGPWAEVGMITTDGVADALDKHGLIAMPAAAAIAALADTLGNPTVGAAVVIADVDWRRFLRTYSATGDTCLFELVANDHDGESARPDDRSDHPRRTPQTLLDRLAQSPVEARDAAVREVTDRLVAEVLGAATHSRIDGTRAFRDLGFDSLMTVELRDRLIAETGLAVSAMTIFDNPSPHELHRHLLGLVSAALDPDPLSQLDQLETGLSALAEDDARRTELAARLRDLADRFAEPRAAADEPAPAELADADADAVIAFLDGLES
ncbi:Mycocerosate synthase., 6-deoxyerythronolide-B synthase OS=Tsukamurella paurometabola (strain ATCC 8368 / DSM / CCUG 35730 / CIP 100753 / JCM 10117 / KCTC 9821 / NBRC 16120 / NCIMB 702349 / NCTC 13040) OX=521096 GN=Tpau_3480 PE=4 SV=1 [Tsukamurella paurometabola]